MLIKLKEFIKEGFAMFVAILVYIPIAIFPKYATDILVFSVILILSCGLYYLSFKSKHKVLLRIFSLYIFSNFIFFPFIYLALLKYDNRSFQFDSNIFSTEKKSSLEEIEEFYDPNTLKKTLTPIDSILTDSSIILDTTIQFLNNGNIITLGHFLLSKNCIRVGTGRPMYKATLNICDKKGHQLAFFKEKDEGCNLGDGNETIREYLKNSYYKMNKRLLDFKSERRRIAYDDDIWTYKQILPYSINIFSTSNMTPKGRIANWVFHLHQFIVATILIGLLVSFFQNFLTKKNE